MDVRDGRYHLTFNAALSLLRAGSVDGIGLALDERISVVDRWPLCVVDLDDVIHDGVLTESAQQLVQTMDTWTEVSHSGRGLHIVAAGKLPPHGRRGRVELITTGYVALTGERWPGTPTSIELREESLRELQGRQVAATRLVVSSPQRICGGQIDDDAVLLQLQRARNSAKFIALFQGDLRAYSGDASRADLALLRMILWATCDPVQAMRLWQRSALYRPARWAQPCRRSGDCCLTYAEATLQRAMELSR
ncbi:hypothetical protein GCM10008955_36110 [Deinococcus malanensis]|uniref:Uncharacterized protein n=1 Tax=Deinococcus malanensis TaxID=1706855 RepID=A0ABQ2F1I3_9DEIO|nr:hypothetical protein GCM10008955_36110 [Deinococcus malanensis]